MSKEVKKTQLLVLGSGPGGYSAAFRAADLGLNVTIGEQYDTLGGVCLNVGCIPSKALLHAAEVMDEAHEMQEHGIDFGKPNVDVKKLKKWKEGVVGRLTTGLAGMAKQRKVDRVTGYGKFISDKQVSFDTKDGEVIVEFEYCIIAAGSRVIHLPFMPKDDPRVFSSTGALELDYPSAKMLVLGGGIIGMEMATVYAALGAEVHVVEMMDQLMPGADKDLVAPLQKRIESKLGSIMLNTKVTKVDAKKDGLYVTFEGKDAPDKPVKFDTILESVGRRPNGDLIDADKAGVNVDERGFIGVDKQMRTNVPHIFAIGDIVGQPMLAHKAVPEGRLAAEVIAGKQHFFDPKTIPSVAYTNPEVAWTGVTETQAKEQGLNYGVGKFPWMANGRSLAMERTEGMTKVLFDNKTNKIIGGGIVGRHAGDLISEITLAIEMGCDAEDIALTIHPHPTLVETIMQATEVFEGTITDLPPQKKKK